ncbi:MAG: hypothetical protein GY883_01435, partial [Shimia sp.]|nr:hypothetical protein [Shimia sp.]
MPDPVSKAEIEDVLTSIRRLVSENRPVSEAPVPEETGAEEAELASNGPVQNAPMALVLTPALRVEEDPEEFSEGADAPLDISAYESDDEAVFDAEDSTEEAEVEAESFLDEEVELPQAVFHHRPLDEEVTSP